MSEQKTPTPKELALQESLAESGLAIHSGGMRQDPIFAAFARPLMPVVSIWHESEIPTPEEIQTLTAVAQDRLRFFTPFEIEGFAARGANMTTLYKKPDGTWTFRRATWEVGPMWYPKPGTLEEIREQI